MISRELIEELSEDMSVERLTMAGLFIRLDIPNHELHGEVLLWRGVLDRALIDLFSTNDVIRKPVERWLNINDPDFCEVCYNADLNPESVSEVFTAMKLILKGNNALPKNFK